MKSINIGLIGFGTVGSGVVKILSEKKSFLMQKVSVDIKIKRICDKQMQIKRDVRVDRSIFTHDAKDILNDPQIDIVVELIGGRHPAKEYISEALRRGKHVVTANKALLAEDGQELFALANDRSKNIYFEASVGAGIPIIKSLREGLVANRFSKIFGILNGTSNFILSKMSKDCCDFSKALKEAQLKGFAERDPSLDVEGIDSAHKLILLTYLCFGRFVKMEDVFIEGISRISLLDISYAKELGFQIKLLGIANKKDRELEVRVHPTLIPHEHLLSSVDGVFNAIYISSDLAGDLIFYGPGAGQLSAASAVVADLVDLTRDIQAGLFRSTFNIVLDKTVQGLRRHDNFKSRYYIRFMGMDKPGVLARISGILAKFNISIASVSQKERRRAQAVPIVMVIHEAREKDLRSALELIDKMDVIKEKTVAIRMEEL
ncbi:MAG: homoserine dehydrogenase [Candidatus Omnitrophica bacterium]|nr:homoserine dehydrogenase [Candidatus Omnitrophota bacterium]